MADTVRIQGIVSINSTSLPQLLRAVVSMVIDLTKIPSVHSPVEDGRSRWAPMSQILPSLSQKKYGQITTPSSLLP